MILGVDPGLTGAFAWTDGKAMAVRDMPLSRRAVSGKLRNVISEEGVVAMLRSCRLHSEILLVEQVNGMPGQSGPAAFTFGYGVGVIVGAAQALGYRIERVHPATWKGALGLPSSKDAARAMAAALYPSRSSNFKRKMDDGRAEACLIAHYGWQVYGRLPS